MRTLLLTAVLFISSLLNLFAQENEAYVWIDNQAVLSDPAFVNLLERYQCNGLKEGFPDVPVKRLKETYILSTSGDIKALVRDIKNLGVFAEEKGKVEPLYTPNDYQLIPSTPSCGNNLPNYHLDLINAEAAWDITTGSSSVPIAIIDQGFNPNHPDFIRADGTKQVIYWDSLPFNPVHGTFVAGCASAATDNATGISGMGYNTPLMLYSQMGNYSTIYLAALSGAKVINLSWGGTVSSSTEQFLINEVYKLGVVIVAAAGNGAGYNSTIPYYPASYDHVISVTSVGPQDNHHHVYNHQNDNCIQKFMLHQHNNLVDIAAPGYEILSTWAGGIYGVSSGTSFASPMVAGVAALMLAANPALSPDEIECMLKASADNIDSLNPLYTGLLGAGRVNAGNAVQMAAASASQAPLTITFNETGFCQEFGSMVTAAVSGGTSPYIFEWNNGSSGDSIIIHSSNNLLLTVKDGTCRFTSGTYQPDLLVDLPVMAIHEEIQFCPGTPVYPGKFLSITGGSGDYKIDWSLNERTPVSGSSPVLNPVKPGALELRITDNITGCIIFGLSHLTLSPACKEDFTASPVGITESFTADLPPYPNPFTDHLTVPVPFKGEWLVTVTDLSGRVVHSSRHAGDQVFLSELSVPSGLYLLRLEEQWKGVHKIWKIQGR